MVNTREQAARNAEASKTNTPGTCQLWTRTQFGANSAGDVDRDGDNDAVDGWKSEPAWERHPGDRNPPLGVPVAFSGGSSGFGHRAISLGGIIRSTDMSNGHYTKGVVGNATIAEIERSMGVTYLGWSETISGVKIPSEPPPAPKPKPRTRGLRVKAALTRLRAARKTAKGARLAKINAAIKALMGIKPR